MAINFPDHPTNGQAYTDTGTGQTWTYELATNSWTASSLAVTGGVVYKGSVDITAAPPTGAKAGEQWSVSTGGTANAGYGPGVTGTITKGSVVMYTGTGWLEVNHSIPDATAAVKGIDTRKWNRTGTVLSPANAGDDVNIGGTNISLKADGSGTFASTVLSKKLLYSALDNAYVYPGGSSMSRNNLRDNANLRLANNDQTTLGTASIIAVQGKGNNTNSCYTFLSFVTPSNSGGSYISLASCIQGSTTAHEVLRIGSTGGVDIGGTFPASPNISLKADGSATFTGAVTATVTPPSDARFKGNITPANPQLADVVALGKQLKNFDWNDKAPLNEELRAVRQLGLIAQEAEKVSPGIVKTIKRTKQGKELTPEKVIPAVYKEVVDPQDERNTIRELVTSEEVIPATYEEVDDSFKGISHDALIMKLLGAVAELSAEVEALKAAKRR
jgi:hypothetical protein